MEPIEHAAQRRVTPEQPRTEPPAVSLAGVSRTFRRRDSATGTNVEFHALANVDIDIGVGEFVALVGSSGCGKTTVLNLVAGLLPPTSGKVRVQGEPPRCPNLDIGYMFARDALLPWRTARRNVEASLEPRPEWSRRRRRERATEMLELVGLGAAANQFRLHLSQGMRQRVALARTLAPDPKILLMDEPFAAVDARTRLQLQKEFLDIWETRAAAVGDQRTVIFVTHDLQEATLLADRVIVMLPNPGRVAFDRPVPLPRPRAHHLHDVMFSDTFHSLHRELFWHLEPTEIPAEPAPASQRSNNGQH
jgi:NitT/TauT family transport system ATP-binding protein